MTKKHTDRRRLRGALATLMVAGGLVGFAGAAAAQAIVVEGNRRVDAETIRSYVTGRNGDLEAARKDLVGTGLFSSVSVTRAGGSVIIRVAENSVINRVAFEGNSKVKGDVLRPELQTKAGTAYSPEKVQADVQRILEIYKRSGRGFARVTPRTVDLPNGRLDVVFTIDEGDKTGVKDIVFVGNNAFSASTLRGVMTTTESNLLSFLKTSDIYDPDRIAADQELIRRYYLRKGYADFRFVSTDARFDDQRGGWVVTFVIEEGEQYRIGSVRLESKVRQLPAEELQRRVRTSAGDVYNAEEVEKTLEGVTSEASRRGFAFSQVRPQGVRNPATRQVDLVYVLEEGPRVYVERINIRGNTRTRDYVVRREFDLGEGDAYNKVLIDRAEKRLNALGFFKKVRITNEPGSAPDRVIVNVDVEDQNTGQFSIAGGYSTSDGFIAEIGVSDSNFLGRGQYVRIAGNTGQYSNGIEFSFTEPYFMGYRMAAGFDLFTKYSDQTRYSRLESQTTGGTIRAGIPLTEEFALGLRYSLFTQEIKIPNSPGQPFNDCSFPIPGVTPVPAPGIPTATALLNCVTNGEAPVAVKEAAGTRLNSVVGYTLQYSTLDNPRTPRNGTLVEFKQDFAGLGGDARFVRTGVDARHYHEFFDDVVGIARVQAGNIFGWGGDDLRIIDHNFLGPTLVRGFAPSGIGPRDATPGSDSRTAALGGTTYFGGSLEIQFPLGLPKEVGMKGALFADAGTLFNFDGGQKTGLAGALAALPGGACPAGTKARGFDVNRNGTIDAPAAGSFGQNEVSCVRDSSIIRTSIGASLLWNSPMGPIRFDYAYALTKDEGVLVGGVRTGGDRTQAFRFSGGTRF